MDERTLRAAQALGVDAVSEILEWALPRWQRRVTPAQISAEEPRVVLRPSTALGKEPVQVWYDEARGVLVLRWFTRDDRLRARVDELGFRWGAARRRYERPVTARMGSPVDRVAELAATLYREGWPVEVPSRALADLVIQGRYQPELRRWVDVLPDGTFTLSWEHGGDEVWQATQHLQGARWSKEHQATLLPPGMYADVRDFAGRWRFAFTDAAQAALLRAEADAARELIGVELTPPPEPAPYFHPRATEEVSIPDDLLADDN